MPPPLPDNSRALLKTFEAGPRVFSYQHFRPPSPIGIFRWALPTSRVLPQVKPFECTDLGRALLVRSNRWITLSKYFCPCVQVKTRTAEVVGGRRRARPQTSALARLHFSVDIRPAELCRAPPRLLSCIVGNWLRSLCRARRHVDRRTSRGAGSRWFTWVCARTAHAFRQPTFAACMRSRWALCDRAWHARLRPAARMQEWPTIG